MVNKGKELDVCDDETKDEGQKGRRDDENIEEGVEKNLRFSGKHR